MQVVVAVATYQRPALLAELLASLRASDPPIGVTRRIVVVDNDPKGSAAPVVEAAAWDDVTYVVEADPGIAAARNRGLDLSTEEDEALIFVDDDERVHEEWLRELVGAWQKSGVEVVTGPVVSVFPPGTPRWITAGGFIQRRRHDSGTRLQVAATNNTLLSLRFWRDTGSERFDAAYSESGGSDTDFFLRLVQKGARIVWHDEAVVEEDVPADRATFRWIWKRAVRGGSVQARIELGTIARSTLGRRLLVSLPYRALTFVGGAIRNRALLARHLVPLAWQVGKLSALVGARTREYRREDNA